MPPYPRPTRPIKSSGYRPYDRVVVVVVKLQSGQHVAWYAMRANDSKKDVVKAVEASANTLTAR